MKTFSVRARIDGKRKGDNFVSVDSKHGQVAVAEVELLNIKQDDTKIDMFVKKGRKGSMVVHLEFFIATAEGLTKHVQVAVDASSFRSGKATKRAVSVSELFGSEK